MQTSTSGANIPTIPSSCIDEGSIYSFARGGTVLTAWTAFLQAYYTDRGQSVPQVAPTSGPASRPTAAPATAPAPGGRVGYYNNQVKTLLVGNAEGLTAAAIAKGVNKTREQILPTITSLTNKNEIRRVAQGRYALTSVVGAGTPTPPAHPTPRPRGAASTAGGPRTTLTPLEAAVANSWRNLGGNATRPQIYASMSEMGTLAAGGKAIGPNHLGRTLKNFVSNGWATKTGDPKMTKPTDVFTLVSASLPKAA